MRSLRAALITAALLVHGCHALPWPRAIRMHRLDNPEVHEEIERWRSVLSSMGVDVESERFHTWVSRTTVSLSRLHRVTRRPTRPLLQVTGSGQGWALFSVPDTHPHRLVIEGRSDETWRVLYRALDPEHDFLEPVIRFRRVRGIYDNASSKLTPEYVHLTRWLAVRAFEAHPDLTEVRVSMTRTHTTLPGERADPRTKRRHARRWTRAEVLP